MQKNLRTYHKNRQREGSYLEKLFGNNAKIIKFSQFYEKHQDDLELIVAVKLNEFVSDPKAEFNSKEIDFYKRGLAEIGKIFAECHEEEQLKKAIEKQS